MHSKTQADWCHPWQWEPGAADNGAITCLLRPLWKVPWVQINTSIKVTDGEHPQAPPQSRGELCLIQVALMLQQDLQHGVLG